MRIGGLITALCLVGLVTADVRAQSLFGSSSGSSGGRSVGSGTITAGQRSFSGSSGGGGAGLTGMGLDNQSSVGQITGNERFVRGNRQPGQFVGADSSDTTSIYGAAQQGALQNAIRSMARNQASFNTSNNRNGSAQNNKTQPRVHLGLAPEFAAETLAHEIPSAPISNRLANLPGLKVTAPLEVTLSGRVATLRGSVATAHDLDLAAQLVLLEPGVSQVVNELVIAPPAPAPAQ